MKIAKKITAALLAAAMAFTALVIPVGADSIENTSTAITSGKKVSTYFHDSDENLDYKLNVEKSGELELNVESETYWLNISVYDSNGKIILPNPTYDTTSGSTDYFDYQEYLHCTWNTTIGKYKGKITYPVSKGKYYIRYNWQCNIYAIGTDVGNGTGKLTFTATYPSATAKKAKISYININLAKGSTLSLGATVTNGGTVTWKSSNSSVVTVSSAGSITAKGKGSAIITAKCGSSSKKVKIVVS